MTTSTRTYTTLRDSILDWPVPDYTTLCRRQKTLAVQIQYRRADGPLTLLVDSTCIKFLGDGEWHARKHGPLRRRQWRKVHLAMDAATSDIRAVEFTSSKEGDSPTLPALLAQIPDGEQIGSVTADGAYDTRRCHAAILGHGATATIAIRKTGGFGGTTARPRSRETPSSAMFAKKAVRAGNDATAIIPEAGQRQRCGA